ncbi:MAG: globin domain-containing protein [Pseudomonadota bacterium]
MILSDHQIDVLRSSFKTIGRDPQKFADTFYSRLFAIAPETQLLFKTDMAKQGQKLMSTLGVLVARLHECEALRPILEDLAKRHVGYGVGEEHYAVVGEALIHALAHTLGEDHDALAAWTITYERISSVMIEAAYCQRLAA